MTHVNDQNQHTQAQEGVNNYLGTEHNTKYQLSNRATVLLTCISNAKAVPVSELEKVFYGTYNISNEAQEECDNAIAELIHLQLVKVDQIGNYITTPNGKRATDEKIAIAYPLGPNGTITNYTDTVNTMTRGAADALTYTIANTDFLNNKISPKAATAIVRAIGVKKVYEKSNYRVTAQLSTDVVHYMCNEGSKNLNNKAVTVLASSLLNDLRNMLLTKINSYISEVENLKPSKKVYLGNEEELVYLSYTDELTVLTLKDVLTLDERKVTLDELNIEELQTVLASF